MFTFTEKSAIFKEKIRFLKNSNLRTHLRIWTCYKIKKSVGRTFDTSRCCRKWFPNIYAKRKLQNCEWLISDYLESWFSRNGQNVHLSDVHDRSEVIKIFHLFWYSIEINLFKHVLRDKMWSRTIGELNLDWTMPKILKLKKSVGRTCRTYLSTT